MAQNEGISMNQFVAAAFAEKLAVLNTVAYFAECKGRDALAADLQVVRTATLDAAFLAHPKRFRNKAPKPPILPTAAWINPPKKEVPVTPNAQPCIPNS